MMEVAQNEERDVKIYAEQREFIMNESEVMRMGHQIL